jgi:hypothetical protein
MLFINTSSTPTSSSPATALCLEIVQRSIRGEAARYISAKQVCIRYHSRFSRASFNLLIVHLAPPSHPLPRTSGVRAHHTLVGFDPKIRQPPRPLQVWPRHHNVKVHSMGTFTRKSKWSAFFSYMFSNSEIVHDVVHDPRPPRLHAVYDEREDE